MKRSSLLIGIICLALIVAVMPLVGACAEAGPTPEKPVVLKYHCPFGASYLSAQDEWWMDEVEKQTEGKVQFDRIFGGTLGTLDQQPMAIKDAVFDMGWTCNVYNPGLYPASTVTILPFLTDSYLAQAKAAHDIFKQPTIEAEFTALNSKYMFTGIWDPQEMVALTPVSNLEELKKLKLRAHGGSADALAAIGMTTYAIPFDELPAAAERHVVDGACMGCPVAARDFGLGDVFPYWIRVHYYYLPLTFTMNMDAWNGLPAGIQKIMTDINAKMPEQVTNMYAAESAAAWETLQAGGMEEVQFDQDDYALIRQEGGQPVWDKWLEDMDGQGIDGQALFDEFSKLVAKYGG